MRSANLIPRTLLQSHIKQPPTCTSAGVFSGWLAALRTMQRQRHGTDDARQCGFCVDCTPQHQDRMRRAGRCEHYLDIQFINGQPRLRDYDDRLAIADGIARMELGLDRVT